MPSMKTVTELVIHTEHLKFLQVGTTNRTYFSVKDHSKLVISSDTRDSSNWYNIVGKVIESA